MTSKTITITKYTECQGVLNVACRTNRARCSLFDIYFSVQCNSHYLPCIFCLFHEWLELKFTFNNIIAMSCRSVLLVEETEVHGETLSHNVVSNVPSHYQDSNSKL